MWLIFIAGCAVGTWLGFGIYWYTDASIKKHCQHHWEDPGEKVWCSNCGSLAKK